MSSAGLSVVVPVYRSAAILPTFIERLEPVLAACAPEHELILVDDSSPDGSWEVISELARTRPWIRGVRLLRNYGQHGAILCGIRRARFETIVTMDDDLQHPPEEIPRLQAELEKGFDVVYGAPEKEQHGFLRDLASRTTKYALKNAMGTQPALQVSAFRIFRAQIRDGFAQYSSPNVSIDVLLSWGTTRFGSLTVRHDARTQGESGYTFWRLMNHALNMLTGFSAKPLQIATITGLVFTLFGFAILAYVLLSYFIAGASVPGFAFLASVIALFSGAQMFALGIIGEYLARIHFRTMSRPSYSVRETTEGAGPGAPEETP